MATLEAVLVPLYMYHRSQVQAAPVHPQARPSAPFRYSGFRQSDEAQVGGGPGSKMFSCRFTCITAIKWKRHEYIFERGHRRTFANIVFAKATKRRGAHLHHVRQSIDGVREG